MKRLLEFLKEKFRSPSFRKKAIIGSLAVFALMLIFPVVTYAYFARDIADPERLMNRNSTGITLLDKNGEVFYSYGRVHNGENIRLKDISDNLEKALIASEDNDFYNHGGYSVSGIARALYGNILNKDLTRYGGSTLTQQLVKNTLLSSDKNMLRKYQELSLAIAVDRHYSKDEILEMYLNSVYFGEGAFGIGPAAKAYFNKSPADLTLAEASQLVGVLPAPSLYSPISGDKTQTKKQQERVLNRMVEAKYITAAEKKATLQQELTYTGSSDTEDKNKHAQHFAQMVIEELTKRYGEERITRSGFTVTTGLDLAWQKAAEEQVRLRVNQIAGQGGTNAGLVAIDPKNGEIRALVGSSSWEDPTFGEVNMATARRQPGSSFKPIYFAEALDKQLITPATILHDSPRTFGSYKPVNYDFRFMGDISARRALAQSRNLTAIEVMEKLGVSESGAAASRMGIELKEPEKHGLALALGTAEARLLDMTNAYAAFANGGNKYSPVSIVSIKDKFDDEIFRHRADPQTVLSPEASFLMNSMLSDTDARAPTFNSLNIPNRTIAVKTGTTNENRDAWTIGYTPSIAVGVWVGNNENRPMSGVAGASGAGPIWRGSMQRFLEGTAAEQFTQPPKIEKVFICTSNGGRASRSGDGTKQEFFIQGTAPQQSCNTPVERPEEKKEEKDEEKKDEKPKEERKPSGDPPTPGETGTTPPPNDDENEEGDGDDTGTTPEESPTNPTTPTPTQPTPQNTRPPRAPMTN